jgi:hypothetical protein
MKEEKKKFRWGMWFLIILISAFIVYFYKYLYDLNIGREFDIFVGLLLWVFGIGWIAKNT